VKNSSIGQATGLNHKHKARLERLARDKPSRLIQTFVNHRRKNFYNFALRLHFGHIKLTVLKNIGKVNGLLNIMLEKNFVSKYQLFKTRIDC